MLSAHRLPDNYRGGPFQPRGGGSDTPRSAAFVAQRHYRDRLPPRRRPPAERRSLLIVSDGVVEANEGDRSAESPHRFVEHRLDKILRAAEDEARDIRATAERATTALLQQAHIEIANREHAQQSEREQRESVLTEAEQQAAAAVAAAHEKARALISDAERDAALIRGHAHNRAQEIIGAAENAASEMTRNAVARVERLTRLREDTRADISRLLRTVDGVRNALAYELDAAAAGSPPPGPDDHRARQPPEQAPRGLSGYRGNGQRVSRTGLSAATLFTAEDQNRKRASDRAPSPAARSGSASPKPSPQARDGGGTAAGSTSPGGTGS
jgi:hypothetical protein